jgi:hypothetical protein
MGLTLHIDTLKFARALKEAGADERLAEAIAGGFASVDTSEFATKTDIAGLNAKIDTSIAELKSEIAGLDAKVDSTAAALRTEMAAMRADMANSFKELYRHLWIMGASIVGLIVAIDKLFP